MIMEKSFIHCTIGLVSLKSDQNSMLHFLFLTANTLPQPCLSLTSLRKNTL